MVAQKLRRHLFILVSVIILSPACVAELDDHNVKLVNRIGDCHKVTITNVSSHHNLLIADAKVSSIQSAGYCGCKSAVLSYAVSATRSGKTEQIEYGRFLSFYEGKYSFLLNRGLDSKNKYTSYQLNIQCASPD